MAIIFASRSSRAQKCASGAHLTAGHKLPVKAEWLFRVGTNDLFGIGLNYCEEISVYLLVMSEVCLLPNNNLFVCWGQNIYIVHILDKIWKSDSWSG